MNFSDILTMRHELMLTIIALVVLIIDLNLHNRDKHLIIPITLSLFFIHTVVGFLPSQPSILFGGMYHTTALLVLMKNVLNVGVLIVLLQSVTWLKKEENREKISEYFILLFSTLIGMYFMISSGDFLMFYLGLELATIPIAALAAYNHHQTKSAEAGIKLILSSALSSGILLFGISLIYGATGSIYFDAIAKVYANSPMQILAFIFFFTGMAFKMSLVPFHFWTADVYEGAPINVTSYLSVISKGAASFIFTIILFTVFKSITEMWKPLIYTLAVFTMTIANLFALRQNNIKRFLAFSSIAQAGFLLVGIIGAGELGMTSVVYFVLVYVFTNLGAFGVVSAIHNASGVETISGYNGLYKTNPKLSLLTVSYTHLRAHETRHDLVCR